MKKKVNLSYIAGLFDGEGCITTSKIMKYNPMMKKRYPCTGHVCDIAPRKKGYKPQKRWQLTHRQVYRVLKKLLPYLRNKDKIKKAKLVMKYYEA